MSEPRHGGRRANQTGRPPKGTAKMARVGALFLPPDDAERLAALAQGDETLVQVARRLLITLLRSLD